jgi:acyl-CoA synthetase (AMP-forming)/AMP-acid ligase II
LTFVDSICEIFGPLLQGYPVTVFSKRTLINAHLLVQNLHGKNITRITLVPSHLKSILDTIELLGAEGSNLLQNIRLWISSGEVLRITTIEQFFKFFPTAQLCNFYGSAEVMGDVAFETFSSFEEAMEKCVDYSVSIGKLHKLKLICSNFTPFISPTFE